MHTRWVNRVLISPTRADGAVPKTEHLRPHTARQSAEVRGKQLYEGTVEPIEDDQAPTKSGRPLEPNSEDQGVLRDYQVRFVTVWAV